MKWYTDIRLDGDWQLTQATNGDAPIVSNQDAFLQDIRLEAMTQEGELFYDKNYGWSLLDFLHSSESETIKLEIAERVRSKLASREQIDQETIEIESDFTDDMLTVRAYFEMADTLELQMVEVSLDRVKVEVIA